MSHNQSRGERNESAQFRKTGRSVSSNQHRQFSGGVASKRGGGSSAPPNPPNRSFKKYNSNAPVGQLNERSPHVDFSNSPAARAAENGAYQQQPTQRVSDAPVISNPPDVRPTYAPAQKITRAVPGAPSSNVSSAAPSSNVSGTTSEPNAPKTPEKAPGDASKSFPLQFGSISPGFMNGMQIPARTSSAPPNLDEQRKAQARHESLRTTPAAPVPSVPNQHSKKIDPSNTGESQQVPKSKRNAQVLAPPPVATQTQKPSLHPNSTGMPMQLPFHQPQVPVPQIQSQAIPGTSLPVPMPMTLPIGSPPVQHSMFVPGLQPHPMQSQGMMHQGQSFSFSPQMGPQLPPQLGSIGMNMPPQFPQQSPVKYSGLRKTVKITHPETHEELKLDSLPNPRLHPNVQSQSQAISSFPPNMPMNFYPPNSYSASSVFFPATSSNTQVPPVSQSPRLYNQVTVKPPIGSHGDKEPLQLTSSVSVGKAESSKSSGLHVEDLHKEANTSSSSCSQQAKPGYGATPASAVSTGPVLTERNGALVSASVPVDGSASASTSSSMDVRVGVVALESVKDIHKIIGGPGQEDQVGSLSTSRSSFPSQLPEAEAKSASSGSSLVSDAKESKPETVGGNKEREPTFEDSKPHHHSLETTVKSLTLESPKKTGKVEETSDREVKTPTANVLEHSQEKRGDDASVHVNPAVLAHSSVGPNTESSVSATGLPVRDEKIDNSDVSLSLPHKTNDAGEISAEKYSEQKPAPVSVPSLSEDALKSENEDNDSISGELVSPSPSISKDKVVSDVNVAKSAVPRGKKKKKDLYKKAEAAGPSSDLYMAYKGPEEKKESINLAEGSENSSSVGEKQKNTDVIPENTVPPHQHPAQSKVEPDDWEDAAEISTQLETSKNENQGDDRDDNEFSKKKYSRDFLLKFIELCTDLPDDFQITSNRDALRVSGLNVPREPTPSPGRNSERHGGGSRVDRRASGLGDEDKWSKYPGPIMLGAQGDMWMNPGYINNVIGLRPGQGGNYGVLRNPRAQAAVQYAGGILGGPMQSFGPQGGLQRNNSDSDRWQRGTGFHKGLMPSPHAPMQVMHKAEKKYEVGKSTDEEEAKQRQLKGILNKLTPQNFEKLFEQVKQVNIDNVITLSGVISQIFDKALMEPTFCEMYANFCFHLAADLPELTVEGEKITFKRLLLNKCQEEFERGEREELEANKAEEEGEVKQTPEEREEKRLKARRRMLGNIRLIGELYKKRMLTERIMHECINKLLGQYDNPDEENIEALCKLMSTIGEMIDHFKAKVHMDAYFDIMAKLSNDMKLSSRVRFMLKDAIDLRKNKWQQRRKIEGPKKIEEVHRDAAQERHAQTTRLSRVPSMGNPVRRGPPSMEFAPRSPMLPSPGSQVGSFRVVPSQLRGGYGSQDARMDERHLSDNARTMAAPLPQRPLGDDSITLGPQGGLARGMAFRGQPNIPSAEMMSSSGDARRLGPGQNGFNSMPQRSAYGQREDVVPAAQSYNLSHPQERDIAHENREIRNSDRNLDRSLPTSPRAHGWQSGSTQVLSSDKVWPEEHLQDKSMATIKEYYSARDEKEVALCINDLNTPSFHPSMISIWVTDSFERKDMERDLLTRLLINLTKPQDGMISTDQLVKGFESVLDVLEDAVKDAPKAAEFLGRIFAKVILENIIPLSKIGQLIYEGGEEQGRLVKTGLAAEVLGSILDIIKLEKGDSVLNEMRSSSKLQLDKFRPPGSNKTLRIDKFV
ncbi:Eukaryotic translation initiation factor 4G [Striga hermonthica]|uniref:Eukaryotic translation initiation factor 4G n=1 Tax=Striga hermonthica TaxID=68872 RepID=A0A9N7RA10_STRHE|nr:Eukaryotic translation initiation factor 4G [Striga hermonthica]